MRSIEPGMAAQSAINTQGAEGATWPDSELIAWIVAAIAQGQVTSDGTRVGFSFDTDIDVPTLVAQQTSAEEWLSLVREGSVLPKEVWSLPEGSPDTQRVEEAYRTGYSLVMRRLHLRIPAVSHLAHRLDTELGVAGLLLRRAVRSNLFASPAGAKGLRLHHDDHDVAVLQLSGTKKWTVYTPTYRFPLTRPDRHLDAGDCEAIAFEGVLRPGSMLFIPRGFPHQAHTDESPSVHITLGAELCTWLDVVTAMATYAEPLRRNVTRADVTMPPTGQQWCQFADELTGLLRDDRMLRRSIADLAEQAMRSAGRRPRITDWNRDRSVLTMTTRVRRTREAVSMLVDLGNGDAALCTSTMRLDGSPAQRPLLDFLHTRGEFTVRELPGDLDDAVRLDLATRLYIDGFFEVVDSDPDTVLP